jgi:xylose isomerase
MDVFARALIIAEKLINETDYLKMRAQRYASYDSGKGKDFEEGKLTLEDLHAIAMDMGEPAQISGKQELLEQMINWFI